MNELRDTVQETLDVWRSALNAAFTAAGFSTVFHPSAGSYRLGDLIVRKLSAPDHQYKITFLRKVTTIDGQRTGRTEVSLYNPKGGLTVHLKGFHASKVAKVVEYATRFVDTQITREADIDAKRRRAAVAREQWSKAGIEPPDWMTVAPNINDDANAGTFHVYFHEHRANYGLQFLSLGQVKRLSDFVKALVAEPTVQNIEAELATKLLQHEGKADDKQ